MRVADQSKYSIGSVMKSRVEPGSPIVDLLQIGAAESAPPPTFATNALFCIIGGLQKLNGHGKLNLMTLGLERKWISEAKERFRRTCRRSVCSASTFMGSAATLA
jgi:hypothetical protein